VRYSGCGSQVNSGLRYRSNGGKHGNNRRKPGETRSEKGSWKIGSECLLTGFALCGLRNRGSFFDRNYDRPAGWFWQTVRGCPAQAGPGRVFFGRSRCWKNSRPLPQPCRPVRFDSTGPLICQS